MSAAGVFSWRWSYRGPGRSDLDAAVMAGTLSLHAALAIAKPEKYGRKGTVDKLMKLWRVASWAERDDFLAWIMEEGDSMRPPDGLEAVRRDAAAANDGAAT
jgi:hypothetical protein